MFFIRATLHNNNGITLRWFLKCNVSIASEMKMRKRAVEPVPLTFPLREGGEEVKLRPYAYIPDLWIQIVQLLESNES